MKVFVQSPFYVDASIYEGFGMIIVEAIFLDKIFIIFDAYIHSEILWDFPLYFKSDNVDDLIEKMKTVIIGDFESQNEEINNKYSIKV